MYLYDMETNFCGQDKVGVIRQDFKNDVKKIMGEDPRAKFGKVCQILVYILYIQGSLSKVYEKVRRDLLATIDNEELKERLVGGGLPSKDSLRTSATTARCVPKAPDSHDEINLQGVPYKDGTAEK